MGLRGRGGGWNGDFCVGKELGEWLVAFESVLDGLFWPGTGEGVLLFRLIAYDVTVVSFSLFPVGFDKLRHRHRHRHKHKPLFSLFTYLLFHPNPI